MSRQTVSHFLKLLYTGYAEGLLVQDFDEIHHLCQLLGVVFSDNSVAVYSPSVTEKASEKRPRGTFGINLNNPWGLFPAEPRKTGIFPAQHRCRGGFFLS